MIAWLQFSSALIGFWLPLKPVHTRQYRTVNLSDGVRKRRRYVHRLVLEAFVGRRPEGMVCCHNDGDPTNNRLDNLRWGTYRENEHDKLRHGTWLVGSQINAKLTEEEVQEIRKLKVEGMTFTELAHRFGVSSPNIHAIVNRRSWRHLP
jgi:DNA-directed RNA polymerase specialized sigma24 family protein